MRTVEEIINEYASEICCADDIEFAEELEYSTRHREEFKALLSAEGYSDESIRGILFDIYTNLK